MVNKPKLNAAHSRNRDKDVTRKFDPSQAATLAAKYAPKPNVASSGNALGEPNGNLQAFALPDLAQFTKEGSYSNDASEDFHLFYVGRDNVHDILVYVLSRVTVSLYLNMYSYDDPELNNILMTKALDPTVTMLITLDKSQSSSSTEKALIQADRDHDLAAYNTHFVIGDSSTGQISHTKGFVADNRAGGEGSTNWSTAGEGIGTPGTPGYKAQNNTQSIFTDPDTISRFQAELIAEHMTAEHQAAARGIEGNKPYTKKSKT